MRSQRRAYSRPMHRRLTLLVLAALVLPACRRAQIDATPVAETLVAASATTPGSVVSAAPPEEEGPSWPAGYTPPLEWEKRLVHVDGVDETWALRWAQPPWPGACTSPSFNGICECEGIVWGLRGKLELVRERPGAPVERLSLGGLREDGMQIAGFERSPGDDTATLDEVVRRPQVKTLKLADYDHDGRSTEFPLQVGYRACGHNETVMVGISKARPHLHVFASAETPEIPLVLSLSNSWEEVRRARGRVVEVPEWSCGDHGTEEGIYTTLRFDAAGIHAERSVWACDFSGSQPRRTKRLSGGEQSSPGGAARGGKPTAL